MRTVTMHLFLNDGVDDAFVSCQVGSDGSLLEVHRSTTDWIDRDALAETARVIVHRLFPVEVLDTDEDAAD